MTKRWWSAALLLLGWWSSFTAAAHAAAVEKASSFVLKNQSGNSIQLSHYHGKVVLLNFWATWCAPCRVEMPWFEEFSARYRDRGLVVIGISMDEEGWKVVRPTLDKLKITYPVALGNKTVAKSYGVTQSLPVTFLIDRNGMIPSSINGFDKKAEFEKRIEAQLPR